MGSPAIDLSAGLQPAPQQQGTGPANPTPAPAQSTATPPANTGGIDLSAGLVPAPQAAAPAPNPKRQPPAKEKDPGVLAGFWNHTLQPLWEHAKQQQSDLEKDPTFHGMVTTALKTGLENSPSNLAADFIVHAVKQAYEQGKKAVSHAGQMAKDEGAGFSALAHGDVQDAAAHGSAAVGEMSQAGGHALAAAVPAIGPSAAEAAENIGGDKPRFGAGQAAADLATVLLPGMVSKGAGELGGQIEKNVAQDAAAKSAAEESKASETAATAKREAAQKEAPAAVKNAAQQAANDAIEKLNERRKPIETPKAEQVANTPASKEAVVEGGSQGEISEGMASKQVRKQMGSMAKTVPERMLPKPSPVVETLGSQAAAIPDRVLAPKPAQEARAITGTETTESKAPSSFAPIDTAEATKDVHSFGDASNAIREAAKPVYQAMDKATKGEFGALRESINATKQRLYEAGSGDKAMAAKQELGILQKEMDKMFDSGVIDKGDADAARQAWAKTYVLDDVHKGIEKAFGGVPEDLAKGAGVTRALSGSKLTNALNKVIEVHGRAKVENAIGRESLENLYRVADAASTPAKAAKLAKVASNVAKAGEAQAGRTAWMKFITRKSISSTLGYVAGHAVGGPMGGKVGAAAGMAADAAAGRVMEEAMHSPRIGKMLVDAANVGADSKMYAPLILRAIFSDNSGRAKPEAKPVPAKKNSSAGIHAAAGILSGKEQ